MLTVQVATPAESGAKVQAVMVVAPNLNATVPVGAPEAEETVAVKVTDVPETLEAALCASVVVVGVTATVCVTPDETLVANDEEPPNVAVMLCVPPGRAVVTQSAGTPALRATAPQPGIVVAP